MQDDDYTIAIEKLENMGFIQSISNHTSSPKIMKSHSNPQQMLNEINADQITFTILVQYLIIHMMIR